MFAFVLLAAGAIVFAFCRPRGVFRFAGIALLAAIILPFALA